MLPFSSSAAKKLAENRTEVTTIKHRHYFASCKTGVGTESVTQAWHHEAILFKLKILTYAHRTVKFWNFIQQSPTRKKCSATSAWTGLSLDELKTWLETWLTNNALERITDEDTSHCDNDIPCYASNKLQHTFFITDINQHNTLLLWVESGTTIYIL